MNYFIKYLSIIFISIIVFSSCSDDDDISYIELGKPIASQATDVTAVGFKAKWTRVYGAESYQLDVAVDNGFDQFVNGFESIEINSTSKNIDGLDANSTYYYRVRATASNVASLSSNVVEVKTAFDLNSPITLKKAASSFFIGTAVKSTALSSKYHELISGEFSSITAEYEMKMNIFLPSENNYNWGPADAIVDYASANGLNVHGHSLIWHNATPDWVKNFSGTDADFETMVKNYIQTVVARYKGKVNSWDVVNEAFEDGDGTLRNSVFRQKMGDDYIEKCYEFVREVDPDVLIFYNDYSLVSNSKKRAAILAMVDDFKQRNVPIDGVGFQMHIAWDNPSKADIESATNEIVSRNLKVHFSELDIQANPKNDLTSLTSERSLLQKIKVAEIVEIYNAIPDENKYALTIWGLRDSESWLINFWGHPEWPLLFDANFEKKDAYYGVLEALSE